MMLSTCTQLHWSTMARPVLSGTCPVKPLYGLGHRAAAQFQGLENLLYVEKRLFFHIYRQFFAVRYHVAHTHIERKKREGEKKNIIFSWSSYEIEIERKFKLLFIYYLFSLKKLPHHCFHGHSCLSFHRNFSFT